MKGKKELENIKEVFHGLNYFPEWRGIRGQRPKYFFDQMEKDRIIKTPCSAKKARAIQTAIIAAAKRQGYFIKTQNCGTYILTKRVK